jgi:hypothetical protein
MPHGHRGWCGPEQDRKPAKLGVVDESKKTIKVIAKRSPDPNNPTLDLDKTDQWVPNSWVFGRKMVARFRRRDWVGWNDKRSIQQLNSWREQVFRRCFGKSRETRDVWLNSEMQRILQLIREQLEEVPGREAIAWNRLCRDFNRDAYGIQRAGNRIVPGKSGEVKFTTSDRTAPWRSVAALKSRRDCWQEMRDLMPLPKNSKIRPRAKDDLKQKPVDPRAPKPAKATRPLAPQIPEPATDDD